MKTAPIKTILKELNNFFPKKQDFIFEKQFLNSNHSLELNGKKIARQEKSENDY